MTHRHRDDRSEPWTMPSSRGTLTHTSGVKASAFDAVLPLKATTLPRVKSEREKSEGGCPRP